MVTAAIVLADPDTARVALDAVLPAGRKRPFHWRQEGTVARDAMLTCIQELAVVSHVCVHCPTGRRGQEKARATSLEHLVLELIVDGVDELVIESRTANDDRRDQTTILDTLRAHSHPAAMTYQWRAKQERLLWIADGICGAVGQHLLGEDGKPFTRLQAAGNVEELIYLAPPRPQNCASPSSRPSRTR